METYDELERKMVASVGRERTDEIRQMALGMGESNLARSFLQDIYKMTLMEALEHIDKVMKKKVVIT